MRDGPFWTVRHDDFTATFVVGEDEPDTVDNVDADIWLPDGTRYGGTFMTTAEIDRILRRWQASGEAGHGSYFRCVNLVVVPEPGVDAMVAAIAGLVRSGEIAVACPLHD